MMLYEQDMYGRAEGYTIVHADEQYLVPTDGKPIRGLIQDHVVAAVLMTKRDTFFTRQQASQLLFTAVTDSKPCKAHPQHSTLTAQHTRSCSSQL
jgi:DNA-directed RNA polymerase I subunit RPA1